MLNIKTSHEISDHCIQDGRGWKAWPSCCSSQHFPENSGCQTIPPHNTTWVMPVLQGHFKVLPKDFEQIAYWLPNCKYVRRTCKQNLPCSTRIIFLNAPTLIIDKLLILNNFRNGQMILKASCCYQKSGIMKLHNFFQPWGNTCGTWNSLMA